MIPTTRSFAVVTQVEADNLLAGSTSMHEACGAAAELRTPYTLQEANTVSRDYGIGCRSFASGELVTRTAPRSQLIVLIIRVQEDNCSMRRTGEVNRFVRNTLACHSFEPSQTKHEEACLVEQKAYPIDYP